MRIAVIDLGTNTFHVLIAEKQADGKMHHLYRERCYVRLAEEGIERIGTAAFTRGLEAVRKFAGILKDYQVEKCKAIGTAALRTAENGGDFIKAVKDSTGITIELVSGRDEAQLIHQGVRLAVPMTKEIALIMDIGGGSVEFIIADHDRVYWFESYPVGVAILFNKFHRSNPISTTEIKELHHYLSIALASWVEAVRQYPVKTLIGASGAFDTIEEMTAHERIDHLHTVVPVSEFYRLHEYLSQTSSEDRRRMEKLPEERAEMIIVAMILLDFIIQTAEIEQITVCTYALKEGVLAGM
jgi:exopolyphosphatase/guanosine-5'-triphosphate,3'-diphosphate pyrophosphatase